MTTTLDLDDFSPVSHELDRLDRLHHLVPGLKVTLFTVPELPGTAEALTVLGFSSMMAWLVAVRRERPWMEFALHGWSHAYKECAEWTSAEAHAHLQWAEDAGMFVRGFKAPFWETSPCLYAALLSRGWWVADHVRNAETRPRRLRAYLLDRAERVHGHVTETQGNGLVEAWDMYTKLRGPFAFVSEVMNR